MQFWTRRPPSHDGLTRHQREAIVDLLHLCMLVDRQIMPAEDLVVNRTITAFGWNHDASMQVYERESIALAQRAVDDQDQRDRLLRSICRRLNDQTAQDLALEIARALLNADGILPSERSLLTTIEQMLRQHRERAAQRRHDTR